MMLYVIVYTILFILSVLLIVLILPVRIRLTGRLKLKESDIEGNARLLLGYRRRGIGIDILPKKTITLGTYQKPIFVKSLQKNTKKNKNHKQESDEKSLKEKYMSFRKIPVMQLIKSVLKLIHWEEFSLKGKLGFSNPMYTGLALGFLNTFKGLVNPQKLILELEPIFSDKLNTDVEGTIHIRLSPLITVIQAGFTYYKFHK